MEYDVRIIEIGEQPVISIRDRRAETDFPEFIVASMGDLFRRLDTLGVPPGGEPFVVYHEFGPHGIDAEVCVPVGGPIEPTERIQFAVLPAMTVARTLHVGPYEALGEAYRAVANWIAEHGFEGAGPMRERYLNAPDEVSSPAEYRTEVETPVVAAPAAVPV
jgi:effector-binding domain-containing protein